MKLLDLNKPDSWPEELVQCLQQHHDLFLDWEPSGPHRFPASRYDTAYAELSDALQPFGITGWHCARLTDTEIDSITVNGMHLPNAITLSKRIGLLVEQELISRERAQRLMSTNQAGDDNRAGMIWFCFFPPRSAGQRGIERFFRHWGGEALYNSHEDDVEMSPVLARIGTPCIVEADVPIASLKTLSFLPDKIARRFLIHHGHQTVEPVDHEDRIIQPLESQYIRRVIRFPDEDFLTLSGCSEWTPCL